MTKEQETFSSGNNANNPEWAGKAHLGWAWIDSQGTKNSVHHTAISRKVVGKNVHATIPKGNIGYDQYTVPDYCSC